MKNRRKLLRLISIVFWVAFIPIFPVMAQEKISIGLLTSLSGPYASPGQDMVRGAEFAVAEVGYKSFGKPLELYPMDTEAKPGVAVRKVTEAIESKKIKFFIGAYSSAEALAVMPLFNEKKATFITSTAADEITGTKCVRYAFRWSVPGYGAVRQSIIPLIKKYPDVKRWYTITPDYVFGHSLLKNVQDIFKDYNITHVGNDMHPIGTTEFSSFFTKAKAANAQMLVFLNFGNEAIIALKQAHSFGLNKWAKIVVPWSGGFRDFVEIGPEFIEGVHFGCQFWHDIDNPKTQAFSKAWLAKYNTYPSYAEASSYSQVKMTILAIEKAKSVDTNAIVKALENMKWDGVTGEEWMQPFDHQTNKNFFLVRAKAKKEIKGKNDLAEVVSFGRTFKSQSQSECRMD